MQRILAIGISLLLLVGSSVLAQQPDEVIVSDETPISIVQLSKIEGRATTVTAVNFGSDISSDLVVGFITLESTNNGPFSGGFELAIGGEDLDLGTYRTRECSVYRAQSGDTAQISRRGPATGTTTVAIIQRPLIASLDSTYNFTAVSSGEQVTRVMASSTDQSVSLDLESDLGQGGYLVMMSPATYEEDPQADNWEDQLSETVWGVEITISGEPRDQTFNVGNLRRGNCEIARVSEAANQITLVTRDAGLTDVVIWYIPLTEVD